MKYTFFSVNDHVIFNVMSQYNALSNRRAWCSALDLDVSGNFLYAGGGLEGVGASGSIGPSLGWVAVCHLSPAGAGAKNGIRPLCSAKIQAPIQEIIIQGDHVVCGGPQPSLRYLSTTSLGISLVYTK